MTLSIERLGPKGDGIGLQSEKYAYVEGAVPGDRVKARVRMDAQGVSRGEILEILHPSPHRQKASCIHYEKCGNCTVQHLNPAFYRQWKIEIVKEGLRKQNLRPREWLDTLFVGDHNRRRATFSGPMLNVGSVDAYESNPGSVQSLSEAAVEKPLRAFCRDLFQNPLSRDELNRYDAIVFDPPRAGCLAQAKSMALAKTPTLIGVSCNPATFARDARILCDGGYRLRSMQIVDQFLWSHHVEMVGVFRKRKGHPG